MLSALDDDESEGCNTDRHSRASVRLGTPDDAEAIAALHAESWRSAYRGLVPDEDLGEGLDAERLQFWRSRFAAPDPDRRVVFLAMSDDLLVGFACVLADADPEHGPLLDNLHVKPGWRGHGIGALLLDKARGWSRSIAPGQPMHLWVLEGNAPPAASIATRAASKRPAFRGTRRHDHRRAAVHLVRLTRGGVRWCGSALVR